MKKRISIPVLLFSLSAVLLVSSCYYDKEEHLYGTGCPTATASPSYASEISPIISANCLSCHSTSNAPTLGSSITLEGYANIKAYITANSSKFSGSINQDGSAASMPKGGSKMSTCNITIIQNWITAGMLNN